MRTRGRGGGGVVWGGLTTPFEPRFGDEDRRRKTNVMKAGC